MTPLLFTNAHIFDGTHAECPEGMWLLVADGVIREVSERPIEAEGARIVDVEGRTLMPGLIDAHLHAYCSDISMTTIEALGEPYRTAHAVRMLGHALDCGFTTVRDVAGGDYSLFKAIADGLVRAPRFFYVGKALSMTGGHGDLRPMEQRSHHDGLCSCDSGNWACRVADGVDACIQATRDELRQGAHCIKIMGSGGVVSPTEHGTLIDDDTARFVAERGAYIVPTMAVIFTMMERGPRLGFPPASQEKLEHAYKQALSGMDKMRTVGVKIGFGTDLLGPTYVHQCREFKIRSEVFTAVEILRQATSISAELMMQQGKLGCIAPGAHADLLLVDGDPLRDISLLAADGAHLAMIVRAGEIVKGA
jgi:imidazolonepropionase-like amidohydrolase